MRGFRILALLASIAAASLAGCESTPERVFTYGAKGTVIQAERFVADVYGHVADPLPYGGPDIDGPLASMKARWPDLKPLLEAGTLGLTDDGEIAIHEIGARSRGEVKQLRRLVRAENRDRHVLYRAMTAAIGHGDDTLSLMIGHTEDTFGHEWITQAPKGWWVQDHTGRWAQK
jgi:hypothetical protein